jgi:hypothetical protein
MIKKRDTLIIFIHKRTGQDVVTVIMTLMLNFILDFLKFLDSILRNECQSSTIQCGQSYHKVDFVNKY